MVRIEISDYMKYAYVNSDLIRLRAWLDRWAVDYLKHLEKARVETTDFTAFDASLGHGDDIIA